MGKKAHDHAVQHYAARDHRQQGISAYRGMIVDYRKRQGIDPSRVTATVLAADLPKNKRSQQSVLKLCGFG